MKHRGQGLGLVYKQHESHKAVPKKSVAKTANCFEEIPDENVMAGSIKCNA
jgi:hypothetical protein